MLPADRARLEQQAQDLVKAALGNEARFDAAQRVRKLTEALDIHRALEDRAGQVRDLMYLGNNASNMADHLGALNYLHEAGEVVANLSNPALERKLRGQLMGAHLELGDFATALRLATLEWESSSDVDDAETCLNARNGLGCVLVAMGDYESGAEKIRDSLPYIEKIEPGRWRTHLQAQSMADLSLALLGQGSAEEALQSARAGAECATEIDHAPLIALNQVYAGRAALAMGQPDLALELLRPALEMSVRMSLNLLQAQARHELANAFEQLQRPGEALENLRAANSLEKAAKKDEAFRRSEFLRARNEIDTARRERETAERVLFTVLPQAIASRIRGGEGRIADEIRDASVLFTDLVGFTALSTRTPPRDLLAILETVFAAFDRLTAEHGLEKIKTIGDAYMVVGGALVSTPDHLERAARLSFAMLDAMEEVRAESDAPLSIRIGLHVGPAIAGVIGTHRLSYDLWGETVNLASRLESTGAPGRVHVSQAVAQRLRHQFAVEPRDAVELKGFGEMRTFFLNPG